MDLKPVEIIAIVIAILVPATAFGLLLIPGAGDAFFRFVLQREVAPFFFGGLAFLVFLGLAYRVFRRIRPAPRRKAGDPPVLSDFWRDPNR
jgi:hypothetical protein